MDMAEVETGNDRRDIIIHPAVQSIPELRYSIVQGPIDIDLLEGGFFGGCKEAVTDYSTVFYQLHDLWAPNFFIGKDQQIYNAMLFLRPGLVVTYDITSLHDDNAERCGDRWFYYQYWLASPQEAKEQLNYLGSSSCEMLPVIYLKELD